MERVDDEVLMMESGWKDNSNSITTSSVEMSPNCPRCGSCNTKFCYYNNYSLTQPRYFCKSCRRYWTKGGSLRNVPVGGGCRKSRRANTKTSSSMHPPSRILTDDDAHNNFDPTRNNYNNPSSSSSTSCDAPNIDLALVYANFLNQKPQPDHDDDACVSTVEYNYNNYSRDHHQLSSEEEMYYYGHKNELEEGLLIEQQYCSSGTSSDIVHSMNFELPPLPGEEATCAANALHDDHIIWSSNNNSAFNSTHTPSHADLLLTHWNHFHFPRP